MRKEIANLQIAIISLAILILTGLVFVANRCVPFMMDDIWYGTNLANGEKLNSISDIIEGQIWHFNNWGGRSITHGILQATLMAGELAADIINTVMTCILAMMLAVFAYIDKKKTNGIANYLWAVLLSAGMIISFNPNFKISMLWQAGSVNYVYSTAWIMLFVFAYVREIRKWDIYSNVDGKLVSDGEGKARNVIMAIAMIPLGLMTGWSNENMGPAAFCLAVFSILFLIKKKEKIKVWMITGAAFAGIGSGLVILAPGNFVRSENIEYASFADMIAKRAEAMLVATGSFLFPAIVTMIIAILIYVAVCNKRLMLWQIMLVVMAGLAHLAMAISPHYPDRATFGVMCVCITVTVSIIISIIDEYPKKRWVLAMFQIAIFANALWKIGQVLNERF